ncbi:WD repeat-containing protein [Colletotrichum truncatum]|uniref:WD repeat-containing protein n=1 Tax=Colletotrichum truncatum TaxID=5467 RepID=A0ACC3ZK87_COLTU|nr:WD repeat-containing protein [Colletotrichum truncatum]KAF6799924.1 WD repeat-containing protein [Colletotrichum truncatum]
MTDSVPHPKTILRGHKAQVHALTFIRGNERLVSGDAEGFVVLWDLTIMRPTAVWRPHENAILGVQGWGHDRIITHGRDHRLVVWQLGRDDEAALSKKLPLDETSEPRPQPQILHIVDVNTMNFCSFASCVPRKGDATEATDLLLAVPNTLASESVDIYELPSQRRLHTVKTSDKNGMVMALALLYVDGALPGSPSANGTLTLVAAYENGLATVLQLTTNGTWSTVYLSKIHQQPILSLDVVADQQYFLTSGADAVVAKHPLPGPNSAGEEQPVQHPLKISNTRHAGQQGLRVRDDGRIFATAGWDSAVRVYSSKTLKEVATLKWHQVGCYAVVLASVSVDPRAGDNGVASSEAHSQELPRDLVPRLGQLTVKDRRILQAQTAHWLAAGSKDGKISLWDIF